MANLAAVTTDQSRARLEFDRVVKDKTKNAIVLFCDMSNSTELSETDSRKYLIQTLRHMYLAGMNLSTDDRVFVKTIGDEVMFSQILVRDEQTSDAVVNTVISALSFMHVVQMQDATIPIKIAIAFCREVLPLESVSLAYVPSLKNDTLGRNINLAARVMSLAETGQVLLTKEAFEVLPRDWKKAVGKHSLVEVDLNISGATRRSTLDFPLPAEVRVKGIRELIKVYQVKCLCGECRCEDVLDTIYKFHCITLIGTSYNRGTSAAAQQKLFQIEDSSSYSPLLCLHWDGGDFVKEPVFRSVLGRDADPPPLTVLFQTRDYESYRKNVVEKLKSEKAFEDLRTTHTIPIWDSDIKISYAALKKQIGRRKNLGIVLWNFEHWTRSAEFKQDKKEGYNVILDMVTTGYYDNIVLLPCGELKDFVNEMRGKFGGEAIFWGVWSELNESIRS